MARRTHTPKPVATLILRPFQTFAEREASGGIMLFAFTVLALAWANSPWAAAYTQLWDTQVTVGFGEAALSKPLLLWINDGLMAIFFFVVGLEIKRELLVGELASPRQALLPMVAAVGGGSLPLLELPSFAIAVSHPGKSVDQVAKWFRTAPGRVVGRIEDNRFLLDLRTVFPEDMDQLRQTFENLWQR